MSRRIETFCLVGITCVCTLVSAVALWMRSPEQARDLAERRENVKYLPGATLAKNVAPTADVEAALQGARMVVSVVPSHTVRDTLSRAAR